ncbi:hypothetical protein [Pantoea rodasii]|uniref:hypothetical protein n=1 Tax=Pantoea rodasii TaxID=1076549 RepID=UPI0034566678
MELWLQGPQSLDELAQLAQHFSSPSSAKTNPQLQRPYCRQATRCCSCQVMKVSG